MSIRSLLESHSAPSAPALADAAPTVMVPSLCPCSGFTPCTTSLHSVAVATDYTLSWRLCPPCETNSLASVSFQVGVPSTVSWFGLGYRPLGSDASNGMTNTDMIIGVIATNTVSDYWNDVSLGPILDQKNNFFNVSVNTVAASESTYFQWTRLLETGDTSEDHNLAVKKTMDWIWTLERDSTRRALGGMPMERGKFRLSLADHGSSDGEPAATVLESGGGSGGGSSSNSRTAKLAHGIIMGIGWGLFMPLAGLAVRYTRNIRKSWLNEHVALTKIGAAGTISFIIVAFTAGTAELHPHALVGTIFGTFVLLVTISGSMAKSGLKNESKDRGSDARRCCRIFHNVIGWMLILVAFYQIPLGVEVLFNGVLAASTGTWMNTFDVQEDTGIMVPSAALRVVVLLLTFLFFIAIIVIEGRRWSSGYYNVDGGCLATCGKLSVDKSRDIFSSRTLDRYQREEIKRNSAVSVRGGSGVRGGGGGGGGGGVRQRGIEMAAVMDDIGDDNKRVEEKTNQLHVSDERRSSLELHVNIMSMGQGGTSGSSTSSSSGRQQQQVSGGSNANTAPAPGHFSNHTRQLSSLKLKKKMSP